MELILDNQELAHQLIAWGFVAFGAGLSSLVLWAAVKVGWQLSDRQRALINEAIQAALAWVEEQAHKGLDAKGAEKLKLAEEKARSLAPKAMASLSTEQFQVLAEAKLQSMRPWMPSKVLRPISIPPPPAMPSIMTPIPPRSPKGRA